MTRTRYTTQARSQGRGLAHRASAKADCDGARDGIASANACGLGSAETAKATGSNPYPSACGRPFRLDDSKRSGSGGDAVR